MIDNYYLILNEIQWKRFIDEGLYKFTYKEIEQASKSEDGYIGTYESPYSTSGVDCYVTKLIK